jgi:ribosomal protein S18 acetylase RimI-like enzyme
MDASMSRGIVSAPSHRAPIIRAASIEDAYQIAVVHVQSWQGAYRGLMPQAYLDGLEPSQRVARWERSITQAAGSTSGTFVASIGGELLGFVSYSPVRDLDADPSRTGEVNAIYLAPAAWGKGIGRKLMEAALERLAFAGFSEAMLWVLDSNARARRFYEAGGWSADGTHKIDERRGFPITEIRYRKPLL